MEEYNEKILRELIHKGTVAYERITENFCTDCKFNTHKNELCERFVYSNAVCKSFTWISKSREEKHKRQVRISQAETICLKRGMELRELFLLTEEELLTIKDKADRQETRNKTTANKEIVKKEVNKKIKTEVIKEVKPKRLFTIKSS